MGGMLTVIRNAFKIPDLKKKIWFTIFMILIFRFGSHIPVPGISSDVLKAELGGSDVFGFLNLLSGGAFTMATIFAMSIQPYITASIIMQLLTVAIPKLEQFAKEGEEGRKKIAQMVRYATVVLAFLQATGLYYLFRSSNALIERGFLSYLIITLSLTAGTAFLMWLGEQITENGIGNGISILIFAGIVSQTPGGIVKLIEKAGNGSLGSNALFISISITLFIMLLIAIIAAVVYVQQAERKIPVQYAKRVVGQKMYGGQKTHIPIKVNLAGVIPIIFAFSFIAFPPTIISFIAPSSNNPFVMFMKNLQDNFLGITLTAIFVIFFTFFYAMIQFNPIEIANNLKKNAGYIPGIRPGKPTSEYIQRVLNRITLFASLFLAAISVFPLLIGKFTQFEGVALTGTGVLILVGVALDTVKQIESQMLMRHYKGFLD